MPAVRASHALVGVGNAHTIGTWAPVFEGPIYPFDTQALEVPELPGDPKDFGAARRHYLFLASRPQIHKGLDLLLEIFPRTPDLHLYVCSDFKDEPDFCACFRRELFETPNVHPVGRVDVASPDFQALARTCAYVIHPSCSEGQAGAVTQGMHAGLVPLVTRESGVDTEGLGG
jgi:glycosyltransferase involved in cell wall biosynthesis